MTEKSYIPVLKYTNGSVEVFTTKFGGEFYKNMKDAKHAIKSEPLKFWLCVTEDVAKMRARDKTRTCGVNSATSKAKASFIEV